MRPPILLLMIGVIQAATSMSHFIPRNVEDRARLTDSCDAVHECCKRTVSEGGHFFVFLDKMWSNETCTILSLPDSPDSFFFERLPEKYSDCPCMNDVQRVVVLRNVDDWNSMTLDPNVNTIILYDKLHDNQAISLNVSSMDFSVVIFINSTSTSDCFSGHHGIDVNETPGTYGTSRGEIHFATVTSVEVVRNGVGCDVKVHGDNTAKNHASLPFLHHIRVRGISSVAYTQRFRHKATHAEYGCLFGVSRFRSGRGKVGECDSVCLTGSRFASIHGATENQEALEYIRTFKNSTEWEIDNGIVIGLDRNSKVPLNDPAGKFRWIDNSLIDYANWATEQPGRSPPKWVMMNTTDGSWSTLPTLSTVTSCLCRKYNEYT